MAIFLPALAGLALGGLKHAAVDKPQEKEQRLINAARTRYGILTGSKPGDVKRASLFGNALQGGLAGAMLGAGAEEGVVDPTTTLPTVANTRSPYAWLLSSMDQRSG